MNGMNEHADTTPTVSHVLKYGGTAIYVDDIPAAMNRFEMARSRRAGHWWRLPRTTLGKS